MGQASDHDRVYWSQSCWDEEGCLLRKLLHFIYGILQFYDSDSNNMCIQTIFVDSIHVHGIHGLMSFYDLLSDAKLAHKKHFDFSTVINRP